MRTTVTIDDKLLELAKARARERDTTLGGLVEEALRDFLTRPAPQQGPPLPVFGGGGGFRPGIDPTSNASLDEAAGIDEHVIDGFGR